jgi:F0F1-type ATP synthase assembly protein I
MSAVCFPALMGGLLGLLMLVIDIIVMGYNGLTVLSDFIFAIIIVILIDYFCKKNWMGIAWTIFIFLLLTVVLYLYLFSIKDPNFMKEIDKEKEINKR